MRVGGAVLVVGLVLLAVGLRLQGGAGGTRVAGYLVLTVGFAVAAALLLRRNRGDRS